MAGDAGTDGDAEGTDAAGNRGETAAADEGFPWYVKAALVAVLLVILFVVVIDLVQFAGSV